MLRKFEGIIFFLLFLSLITPNKCSYNERVILESDKIYVRYDHQITDRLLEFAQTINISIFHSVHPDNCTDDVGDQYCLKWGDFARFKINKIDNNCENFEFKTEFKEPLEVVFNITGLHVYGGTEQLYQTWPVENFNWKNEPFVSDGVNATSILEPLWLTSTGFSMFVDQSVPLFVSINKMEGILKITANRQPPYIRGNITYLKYKVCKYENVRVAQEHAVVDTLGKPTGVPDFRMVQFPIWSTWAKYKANISEPIIVEFAELINRYGLPNSQLEIDDKWETCYGSLEVDTNTFPDMKRLVKRLKNMGFRVTMWIHPFVNEDCEPFYSHGSKMGYFVADTKGSIKTVWWNGNGSLVDFTNEEAVKWWVTRLKKLMAETGIDSYKFDAGESNWCPQLPVYKVMNDDHPDTIIGEYVEAVTIFGDMIEVRVSRGTQKFPIFVRMIDRETTWTGRLSMQTLIPTLLHMNIIGYPFVLPDMIGGNTYNGDVLTEEMFVRWLQITVFMPSLQFSYPPWDFGEKVLNITKKYISLHSAYANKIYDLMKESTESGAPVNRPLWWIDPTDPVTYTIDSEFLLGNDLLVAPVMENGARSRNIYFPRGVWKDEVNKSASLIRGPIWMYNYPADLEVLPYFSKISSTATTTVPISLLFATIFIALLLLCK